MKRVTFLTLIFLVCLLAGCSSGTGNPVVNIPQDNTVSSERSFLAVYNAVIDSVNGTFTITPNERSVNYHIPLSRYFPNVLRITGVGFDPNFWADITLTHPFPGSGIDGYDPRVIAILPANTGVRFIYPNLGIGGNNAVLLEDDGYTKLYDELGGSILGNVNPFKAYFKDQPYRCWSSTGTTSETQRWEMDLAGFGGAMQFYLVVDVSTNYPAAPSPVTDNAPEPVQMDAIIGPGLMEDGGSADVTVTLLDWQGQSGIGGVKVEAPELFNGTVDLSYDTTGPNPDEYIYSGTISNSLHAPMGDYKVMIATRDISTGIYLYDEFTAVVSGVDIQPPIWDSTVGITSLESAVESVIVSWGTATDTFSPPVEYLIYYDTDDDPWDQTPIERSDNTPYTITGLTMGQNIWAGVRCRDSATPPNTDTNTIVMNTSVSGFMWGQGIGTTYEEEPRRCAADADGNIYMSGSTRDDLFRDNPNHYRDVILVKYDPNGAFVWGVQFGSTSDEDCTDIQIDSAGNIYLVGGTFGELFEPELSWDYWIASFTPGGGMIWGDQRGSEGGDNFFGMALNESSNLVYVTGFLGKELWSPSFGGDDIGLACYSTSGVFQWGKQFGSDTHDRSQDCAVDPSGNVILCGGTQGALYENNEGGWDFFVSKFDPTGAFIWGVQDGLAGDDGANSCTCDSQGNIYVAGLVSGPLWDIYNGGARDCALFKLDTNGGLQWGHNFGGNGSDGLIGIALNNDDEIYTVGAWNKPTTTLDLLINKHNSSGEGIWSLSYGGADDGLDHIYGCWIHNSNYLYISGMTASESIDLDPGAGTCIWNNVGDWDGFVSKFYVD